MEANPRRVLELMSQLHMEDNARKREEASFFKDLCCSIYIVDRPKVELKADFLEAFSEGFPLHIDGYELIVGGQWFLQPDIWPLKEKLRFGNMGHVLVDYGGFLKKGIHGLLSEVRTDEDDDERTALNKRCFTRVLRSLSHMIRRYADHASDLAKACDDTERRNELTTISGNCLNISSKAPATFWEALQLIWFIQVFLHAEGVDNAFSFGRMDQYLWPFYVRDVGSGAIPASSAEELLKCLFIKASMMEESQNLVVGGVDADGESAENELSVMLLRVAGDLLLRQPSMSVRITKDTSEELWAAALKLTVAGTGMPSYFNDACVAKSLVALGLPLERARDFGIVGCYEATPQGDTHGLTIGGRVLLPVLLNDFLGKGVDAGTFDGFLTSFKKYVRDEYLNRILPEFNSRREWIKATGPSPFLGVCLDGCLKAGLTAEEGGAVFDLFGVNILGFGTVVDSIYVIRQLVYEMGTHTLGYFRDQLGGDFGDQDFYLACRHMEGKYGTDNECSNALARDLSDFLFRLVVDNGMIDGVKPNPGLFAFLSDIHERIDATPDGRRRGERVSYGCGPTEYSRNKTPTSVLNSVMVLRHDGFSCGNPLTLSFTRDTFPEDTPPVALRQLVQTYFDGGGFHLHFNIVDSATLERAKAVPDEFNDLLIRISGLSARFVSLDEDLQNAIIERTRLGM